MAAFEEIQLEGLSSVTVPGIISPLDIFGRVSIIPSSLSPPVVRIDDRDATDPIQALSLPSSELSSLSLTGQEPTVGMSDEDPLLSAMSLATVPLPDLVVTDLSAPPVRRADTNIFPVSWTIANQGTGATTSREWIDGFYPR
jgi:hypothetical protein